MAGTLGTAIYDAFVEARFTKKKDLQKEYYTEVNALLNYNIIILRTEGIPDEVLAIYTNFLQASISKEVLISISTKAIAKNKNFKRALDPPPIGFEITPTVDEAMNYIREEMKRIGEFQRKQQERDNYIRTFRKKSVNPIKHNMKLLNRATLKPRNGLTGPSAKSRKTLELSRRSYHRGISFNPKKYTRLIPTKEENQRYTGHIPSSTRRVSKPLFSHYTRKGRIPRHTGSPSPKKGDSSPSPKKSIFAKIRRALGY